MTQAIEDTVVHLQNNTRTAAPSLDQLMDEFRAKLDSELEACSRTLEIAEDRFTQMKALCEALPQTLPMAPHAIDIASITHKADAELIFEVTTRAEVLQLLAALPGVAVLMLESGCTSFIAEERLTEKDSQAKAIPVGEVLYHLSHWLDAPQESYTWWTHLAGKLVYVRAKTKKGHSTCAKSTSSVRRLTPPLHEVNYHYENLPNGVVTQWYGGTLRSMAPITVHQWRGNSFQDAVAKPMSANTKFNVSHCDC